jgi:hypothetical protein
MLVMQGRNSVLRTLMYLNGTFKWYFNSTLKYDASPVVVMTNLVHFVWVMIIIDLIDVDSRLTSIVSLALLFG